MQDTAMRRLFSRLGLTALVVLGVFGQASAADSAAETKTRLLDHVKYLASDELEGRGVGTAGLDAAAKFVKEQFAAAGLDVTRVNGDAFQKFDMITGAKLAEAPTLQLIGPDGQTIDLKPGVDFEACSFAGSGSFDAELVFAGYAVDHKVTERENPHDKDSPEKVKFQYSDFDGVDVKGKVVVVMRRFPQQGVKQNPFSGGRGTPRLAELRTKLLEANRRGAVGVLFVNDPYSVGQKEKSRQDSLNKAQGDIATLADAYLAIDGQDVDKAKEARQKLFESVTRWKSLRDAAKQPNDDELMKFGYAGYGDENPMAPAAQITQAQVDALLKGTLKKSLAELEAEIDSEAKPRSAALTGWKVKGNIQVQRVRSDVANVIGVVEGEGPLADETIVIGAHYDHVGRGGQNSLAPNSSEIHNGADDNASGTVALVELARRFAGRSQKPPRRLVFIAFTAEELGLIGSARYVKEPVFPLEKTVAMFNLDMVGRLKDDKLSIFGSGTSPRWEPELKALNEQAGFKLTFKPEGFGPSDHSSFYGKKIPVLHFFTNNHPDYHRPTDDWDKINVDGMLRVVDMLEQMIVQTLQNSERPAYVEVKQPQGGNRGGNRPYFGSIPDFGSDLPGYSISGAAPGSPAERAGLKAGDRMISIGGNKVTGLDDFDLALRKFKAGDEAAVIVVRDGKEVELKVTLDPPR
jgi:hypothetical protein